MMRRLYSDANEHEKCGRKRSARGDGSTSWGGIGGQGVAAYVEKGGFGFNDDATYNLIPAVHITHNGNNAKYTLLYSHGNAEDLGLISSFLSDLARLLQVDILCYDYSGYGVGIDIDYVTEFFVGYDNEIHFLARGGEPRTLRR
jgi:hypothetical protein